MKLSTYAKQIGVNYRTAWSYFKKGEIAGAYQLKSGTVVVPNEIKDRAECTACYSRVSSSENKKNLTAQSIRIQNFCAAKGWIVGKVEEECASGLNDKRPKLLKLLKDKSVTRIVIEHKDRLTRFGYNYIKELWDGELIVINEVARLYGQRRSKRRTEKIIEELSKCD